MFISRFLQVVIILIYLFNLLTVACSRSHNQLHNQLGSSSSVVRKYQLFLDCDKVMVEVSSKRVGTTKNRTSVYTYLEVSSAHPVNHGIETMRSYVTIMGHKSQQYLCINKKGKLIKRHSRDRHDSCIFNELTDSGFFTQFRSVLYPDLYLGFARGRAVNIRRRQHKKGFCNRFIKLDEFHHDPYNEIG